MLESEGYRQRLINESEGDRQSNINKAQGEAESIRLNAQASADSIRLLDASLRSAARSYALEAVRKIVAQLEADRRLINAVRDELLELERLATSVKACTPAIRRWYATLVNSGSIVRWKTLAAAAPRLQVVCL